MDKAKVEQFCKKFANYVTGNWRDNHLHIYVDIGSGQPRISCYGLGKVNYRGDVHPEDPFYEALLDLIKTFPEKARMLSVEFFCGKICKVEIS